MSSTSAFSSSPRPLRWLLLAIRPRLWLASGAVMLAVASLSGKIAYYSRPATGEAVVSAEQRATDLFIRYGWTAIGTIEPERHTTLRFIGPMCPAGIQVTVVPPGGEISGVLARAGGEDNWVFYVHGGKISDEPPRFIYIEERIRELLRALGIAWSRSWAVFAIVGPVQCQLRRTLPWSDL